MPLQVPEDRLGRLEQEHRTLALELRLTVSVAEEAVVFVNQCEGWGSFGTRTIFRSH